MSALRRVGWMVVAVAALPLVGVSVAGAHLPQTCGIEVDPRFVAAGTEDQDFSITYYHGGQRLVEPPIPIENAEPPASLVPYDYVSIGTFSSATLTDMTADEYLGPWVRQSATGGFLSWRVPPSEVWTLDFPYSGIGYGSSYEFPFVADVPTQTGTMRVVNVPARVNSPWHEEPELCVHTVTGSDQIVICTYGVNASETGCNPP